MKSKSLLDYGYKDGYNRYKECPKEVVIVQKQFSIAEAKNKLPTIVHYVEKGPSVELTRRGKPVAVLLSIQEYQRLSRKYTGFWSAVTEFRRKVEDEGVEISDRDFKGVRDLSSGREVVLEG